MSRLQPSRSLTTLSAAVCLAALSPAQILNSKPSPSHLPPTYPTQASQASPAAVPTPSRDRAFRRAEVSYINGRLAVSADNSSLNQIFHEISHLTGMKITGNVNDEHVFGRYGPALPAEVMATLLEGTGSNMLLLQHASLAGSAPLELVLTPRQGGATPPNPNAHSFNEGAEPDQAPREVARPFPAPTVVPADPSRPAPAISTPQSATPPSTTTQQESPNGIKTPQQIYDQLLRLRQQSQPTPSQTNPPTAPR